VRDPDTVARRSATVIALPYLIVTYVGLLVTSVVRLVAVPLQRGAAGAHS
jgi:hypothetical protein